MAEHVSSSVPSAKGRSLKKGNKGRANGKGSCALTTEELREMVDGLMQDIQAAVGGALVRKSEAIALLNRCHTILGHYFTALLPAALMPATLMNRKAVVIGGKQEDEKIGEYGGQCPCPRCGSVAYTWLDNDKRWFGCDQACLEQLKQARPDLAPVAELMMWSEPVH
jgi:hypothetical protein